MAHRIRNCSVHADDPNLADASDTKPIAPRVVLRNHVIGEIRVVTQAELDEVIAQALQASPYALEAFYRELTTVDMRQELAA